MTGRQDDPPTQPPPVSLAYGPDRGQFDFRAYSRDLTALARNHLQSATAAAPAAAARAVQERAEAVLADYPEAFSLVACAAGCSHCCVMNVAVLAPEAAAIARHLQTELPPPRQQAIRLKLQALTAATATTTDAERLALHRSCAFLDERGCCEIHRVRPLLCRRVTSIDAQDCQRALEMQEEGTLMPIVADLFHQQLFEVAFLALAEALDGIGIGSESGRLSEEVLRRLEN